MSETTNLKLFKHDNPSTNTNQFDIETALNENWDKIDESAGENIQNIEQLQQENEELKLENQRLREDIDNVIPIVSGSGESITLNKTSNARFKKLEVKGNSKQDSYSGKNKINCNSLSTITKHGIAFTPVLKNGLLECINAKGTSTVTYSEVYRIDMSSLPAGNYILSGLGTNSVLRYVLLKENDSSPKVITTNTDNSFTQDNSSPYVSLRIDIYATGDIDAKIKPMIRLATETDATYEPYVGGQASPNSEYKQEVKCVGDNGNANAKVENKNKLNKDKVQIGKYFNANSTDETLISSGNTLTTEWISCKPNTTYIMSGGYNRSRWQTKSKKGEITYIGDNMRQITTNDEACYFRCYFYANYVSGSNVIPDVQIEEGSTSTNYIEHEEQTFTIPTQQPMRKIEDYQDTFVKQNNKWYEKHLIKEVILNGTENWAAWGLGSQSNTKAYVYRTFPSAIESTNQYAGCKYLSDSFLFSDSNNYEYDKEILFINENNACGIRLDTDKASDLASFKEYLSNNNITVCSISAEPTYIECTQEQSDILDEIENTAHSYEGTTHILSTDEISSIFEVEALASLKALFEEVGS